MTTQPTPATVTAWNALPDAVTTYLNAQDSRDVDSAIRVFADRAQVTDEGHTHRGRDAIESWLRDAGSEFSYTTEFTGATTTDASHVVVTQHLEGDFPGGVADLHYRFTLDGDRILRLVIEP